MFVLLKEELVRRRVEHFVGAAAVAVVAAAVVAQRSMAASAEGAFHDLAHRLGANMLVLPRALDPADFYRQEYGTDSLPRDIEQRLRNSPAAEHLRSIDARLLGYISSSAGRVLVVGEAGPWPLEGEGAPAVPGTEAARRLGVAEGASLELGGETLRVLGIAKAAPTGLDEAVFVPLAVAQRMLHRPGETNALDVGGCWCRIDVAALARQVEQIVPGTRAITIAGMQAAQTGSVAAVQRLGRVSFAAGSTLIAVAIAVMTLAQTRRRRREIGLLLAVGASPQQISSLFTLQAALGGAVGGAAGWALAWPLTRFLSHWFLGIALAPSLGLLPAAAAACACIAAVAAHVPARLAVSRDPTEVLHEA